MLKGMTGRFIRIAALVACAGAALPALADSQFRVRRMQRNDVPFGKGQCDIRLQVDNEVEVTLRGDTVFARTIAGQEPRDDGSECNEPLPVRAVSGFNFAVVDSRNDIRLLSEPSRRTNFAAVVRIRDSSGGFGRYHFRITWDMTGGSPGNQGGFGNDRPDARSLDRPSGGGYGGNMAWNNVMRYSGPGRGQSVLQGSGTQRLADVSVNIDRGGHLQVSFRTESGRPLSFTGTVMGQDGGTIKADVATDDRRLRGPMYLSIDNRSNVYRVSLEATDGRDRLRLNWDRR
jgi:hypothetical protein